MLPDAHTHTPGMFWPPYMNLPDIFRRFKTTSSLKKQRAEKTKKKQWLSFMQNSPVCSRFPWAIIAELHALFHCCIIGALIFYEYQACPLVSVGEVARVSLWSFRSVAMIRMGYGQPVAEKCSHIVDEYMEDVFTASCLWLDLCYKKWIFAINSNLKFAFFSVY